MPPTQQIGAGGSGGERKDTETAWMKTGALKGIKKRIVKMRERNVALNNPYRTCACLSAETRLLCYIDGLKSCSREAEFTSELLLRLK